MHPCTDSARGSSRGRKRKAEVVRGHADQANEHRAVGSTITKCEGDCLQGKFLLRC
jgi:hypothetical protein